MNVWAALPRLLASSRCPQNVRFLVEERLSSSIRLFSTNTPVSTETPESHFSELLKKALEQADSKVNTSHSAPRLQSSPALTLRPFKKKPIKKQKRRRASKGEKKVASHKKNGTETKQGNFLDLLLKFLKSYERL